jgi:predicted  nucleic acid-binding Zn-ribbon protein
MSVLSKLTKKLPEVPVGVDEHPRYLQHQADMQRLVTAIDVTRTELTSLDARRADIAADVAEAGVQQALGESDAAARVSAGKRRLGDLDQEIGERRERLASQEEARRRLTTRTGEVQAAIEQEIAEAVRDVHVTLLAHLAQALEQARPISDRLLELRARHGESVALQGAVWLDGEITPATGSSGLPNRAELWRRQARKVGVDV